MKQFKIIIHNDDAECIVTANDEEEAEEKFWEREIDEWLILECEQPEIIVEEIQGD